MKSNPSMKKPHLDIEDVALEFVSGISHKDAEQDGTSTHPNGEAAAATQENPLQENETSQNDDIAAIKLMNVGTDSVTISAEGCMNIYGAQELKPALMNILQKYQSMEIDLSGVCEMDTAGIQLLLLLKRSAARSGKNVSLIAHSQASLDAIGRYNLGAYFGIPSVVLPDAT